MNTAWYSVVKDAVQNGARACRHTLDGVGYAKGNKITKVVSARYVLHLMNPSAPRIIRIIGWTFRRFPKPALLGFSFESRRLFSRSAIHLRSLWLCSFYPAFAFLAAVALSCAPNQPAACQPWRICSDPAVWTLRPARFFQLSLVHLHVANLRRDRSLIQNGTVRACSSPRYSQRTAPQA